MPLSLILRMILGEWYVRRSHLLVKQLGSTKVYIEDIAGLMQKLKDHHIYAIARIPAFRDGVAC